MNTVRPSKEWFSIIQKCRASGLSDREWCQQHGISTSSFYYHIRKLRNLACDVPARENLTFMQAPQEVVPLIITDDPVTDMDMVPNTRSEHFRSMESSCLRIECGGISVTLPDKIAPETLCSVIQALRTGC